MTTQIHGHEVIEMMMTSNEVYSKNTLQAAILAKYGAEARFHTCSAENMTAAELIEFLGARGKFTGSAAGFAIDPDKVCQH